MADVAGFFKKLAPFLTTDLQFGGPAGQIAAAAIRQIPGMSDAKVSAPGDLAAAMATTPDQQKFIEDLKSAEQQFQLQMKQLDINSAEDLEKIAADDRASARAREIALRDKVPMILAVTITAGFFGILMFVFMHGVQDQAKDMAYIMVGTLGTAWGGVVNYYFGSSHGSDKKTEILAAGGKTAL